MIAYLLTLLLAMVSPLPIDLSLEQRSCDGVEVTIDVIATSEGRFVQRSSAISILIEYPADDAKLLRVETDTAGVDWFVAGFLNDPDNFNQDIEDGLAVLTLLGPLTDPAIIQTRCGTVLATLVFELPSKNAKPFIDLPLSRGNFGVTAIYGEEPGTQFSGTATGVEVSCKGKAARVERRGR